MKTTRHVDLPQGVAIVALVALVRSFADADANAGATSHPHAVCHLLGKDEAARYLGVPVGDAEAPAGLAGCAYRALGDPTQGVLVTRLARGEWFVSTTSARYHAVSGVGERAYTDFEPGVGYEAVVLAPSGVTNVQLSTRGTAADALALAELAMAR